MRRLECLLRLSLLLVEREKGRHSRAGALRAVGCRWQLLPSRNAGHSMALPVVPVARLLLPDLMLLLDRDQALDQAIVVVVRLGSRDARVQVAAQVRHAATGVYAEGLLLVRVEFLRNHVQPTLPFATSNSRLVGYGNTPATLAA
jgi:hypothetical protein